MNESSPSVEWSKNISKLCQTTLELPPSCLAFLPSPNGASNTSSHLKECYAEYFVVGTYYLEKEEGSEKETGDGNSAAEESVTVAKPQSKNGSLVLFRYRDEKLSVIQTLPVASAVFDLHFFPNSQVFGIVSSSGTVGIFRIAPAEASPSPGITDTLFIKEVAFHQVFTEDIAPTYFTWAPESQQMMAIATSDGGIYLANFSASYDTFRILNNGEPVTKHSEYAWCCSFSSSGDRLYSGGDDSKLRLAILDKNLSNADSEEAIESSGLYPNGIPGHEAGVTFILPIPLLATEGESQYLLTGSYDDNIRILSIPDAPARPKVLTQLHLGGGVWRLKVLGSQTPTPKESSVTNVTYTILASCMHAGAKLLFVNGTRPQEGAGEWSWEIKVLAEMKAHKSMNYASDVQPTDQEGVGSARGERSMIFVSSSFYDRLLCVWRCDL